MKVELTPERHAWIAREIEAGTFASEQQAIEMACRAYERNLARLRAKLDVSIAQAERGEVSEWNPDAFKAEMREKYPHLANSAASTRRTVGNFADRQSGVGVAA